MKKLIIISISVLLFAVVALSVEWNESTHAEQEQISGDRFAYK